MKILLILCGLLLSQEMGNPNFTADNNSPLDDLLLHDYPEFMQWEETKKDVLRLMYTKYYY